MDGVDTELRQTLHRRGLRMTPQRQLVLDAVRTADEVSAAECADLVGISRVSARRYLEHYLGTGALELRLQYGVGRPERRYRFVV